MAFLGPSAALMPLTLPSFKKEGGRFVQATPELSPAVQAESLMRKHRHTISELREKLGFQNDKTVVAWLLEQIELAPDLDQAIYKLLED